MSNPMEKLEKAKLMLDRGLINESDYERVKNEVMAEMGMIESTSQPIHSPDAETQEVDFGSTRVGGLDMVPDVSTEADPFSGRTNIGLNDIVPPSEADLFSGATHGMTIMGKKATIDNENIDKLPAGTVFDGLYSIVSMLGVGGMGVVYQAVDKTTSQLVALKVLRPVYAKNARIVSSLIQEVSLGQKLNHPNLLQIRHLDVRGETPYVVMELMDGGDVEDLLGSKGGILSQKETLRILEGTCSALSALHKEAIIHLDIKPQNVLLGKDGRIRLADFGISSSLKEQRSGHSGAGTLLYASPEQLSGKRCAVAADVYALGIMTYQLLTGGFPFSKKLSESQLRTWHERGERDFSGVSGKLQTVLNKACTPDAEGRYRSVQSFYSDVEKALQHKPWYPESINEADVYPHHILFFGEKFEVDVLDLLRKGVLTPTSHLIHGKVVMETNPFALAEVGDYSLMNDELKLVCRQLSEGDESKIVNVPKLASVHESMLAMFAKRVGAKNRVVQKRIFYAESAVSSLEDKLTLAYTYKSVLGDTKRAEGLLTTKEKNTPKTEVQLAIFERWLLVNHMQAQQRFFYLEEKLDSMSRSEMLIFAQGCVILFQDWSAADSVLKKLYQNNVQPFESALRQLEEDVCIFGLRNPLLEYGLRLNKLSNNAKEHLLISQFWKRFGVHEQAELAKSKEQSLYREQYANIQSQLSHIGIDVDMPDGELRESDVTSVRGFAKQQLVYFKRVAEQRERLLDVDMSVPVPKGILKPEVVHELETFVDEQIHLHSTIKELCNAAEGYGITPPVWKKPYSKEEVNNHKEEIQKHHEVYMKDFRSFLQRKGLNHTDFERKVYQFTKMNKYEWKMCTERPWLLNNIRLKLYRKTKRESSALHYLSIALISILSLYILLFIPVVIGQGLDGVAFAFYLLLFVIPLILIGVEKSRRFKKGKSLHTWFEKNESTDESPIRAEVTSLLSKNFLLPSEFSSLRSLVNNLHNTQERRHVSNQKYLDYSSLFHQNNGSYFELTGELMKSDGELTKFWIAEAEKNDSSFVRTFRGNKNSLVFYVLLGLVTTPFLIGFFILTYSFDYYKSHHFTDIDVS